MAAAPHPALAETTNNLFLQQLRMQRGYSPHRFLSELSVTPGKVLGQLPPIDGAADEDVPMPEAAGAAKDVEPKSKRAARDQAPKQQEPVAIVDWRLRFKALNPSAKPCKWLAAVKGDNTNKPQHPCNYAAVGVVEAMLRIEHGVWAERCEDDVAPPGGDTKSMNDRLKATFDVIVQRGLADCPADGAFHDARQTKITGYVILQDFATQKQWVDAVGPLAATFAYAPNFETYTGGVYAADSAAARKDHTGVIVGYSKSAWLVRNCWGPNWGMDGYCWIAFGTCGIDARPKFGVAGSAVDPDPWCKLNTAGGTAIAESRGQRHQDLVMFTVMQNTLVSLHSDAVKNHFARQWSTKKHNAGPRTDKIAVAYSATASGRRIELLHVRDDGKLQRWSTTAAATPPLHQDTAPFAGDVCGVPAYMQCKREALFVAMARTKGMAITEWHAAGNGAFTLATNQPPYADVAGDVAFTETPNGLYLVYVNKDGHLQYCRRTGGISNGMWQAPAAITGQKFGGGFSGSTPVLIQSHDGTQVDQRSYQLCIAKGGKIEHWGNSENGGGQWRRVAVFGSSVTRVLSLLHSSSGTLQAIAKLQDGSLQRYTRTLADDHKWHAGEIFGRAD
jgi:hypothetical protein